MLSPTPILRAGPAPLTLVSSGSYTVWRQTMTLRWLLAAFHLLALGIGLGAVVTRAFALRSPFSASRLPSVFLADTLWGLAALLWFGTGLWRAFGGVEKGTAYYL